MHKIRILWYQGIMELDSAAEPRANATCDFTHRCIAAKSGRRFFDITWCINRMVRFFFGQGSTISEIFLHFHQYLQNMKNWPKCEIIIKKRAKNLGHANRSQVYQISLPLKCARGTQNNRPLSPQAYSLKGERIPSWHIHIREVSHDM